MENLYKLNPQQQEAALHKEGPLLILAGAGSGKTATMTHRIANLITQEGVNPYHILAVTFTNKAAGEMRDRVEALVGEGLNMWILTFHAACLRILRQYGERLGYRNNFAVYDPTDQKTVMKNIIKEYSIDDKKYNPSYLLSIISNCKENMETPEDYIKANGENPRTKIIYQVYKRYETVLKTNNAMDFDDLLLNAVRLFAQEEEVLLKYQNRFQYIMVDEYQDTNHIQYTFIKMLAEAHNNICVVGDDDQCIYQWRGADIRNILDFEKDFKNTKVIKLEENYRSTGYILDAAHSVISNNKSRKEKKLWTAKERGTKIDYCRVENEKEEARHIAHQIDILRTKDRKYSDFAILYRVNAQSRTFEEALSAKEIPYRVLGGLRYYDRKEIKDIMSYMRLVQNPADDLSLVRIINEPRRGIGPKTLEKLRTLAEVRTQSLFDALADEEVLASMPKKAQDSIRTMVTVILDYSREQSNLRVSDIYDGLLTKTGYLKALEDQDTIESNGRIENLLEFKSVIYDYEKEDLSMSLSEFMEKIALMAEVDNHNQNENAVVLMTMHSAKGLEFPIVFLPGMEDGLFPSFRSFEKPDGLDEERRLCYVGMTRAKERLFLSSAEVRMLYGSLNTTRESQFLKEIDRDFMSGDAVFDKNKGNRKKIDDGFNSDRPFNPFAQLKQAQKIAEKKVTGPKDVFVPGDKVKHAKFGYGVVMEMDKKTITVVFHRYGTKKLVTELAPLEKTGHLAGKIDGRY